MRIFNGVTAAFDFGRAKEGKEILDPLTDEAGGSLLNYKGHGRPKTVHREVLLIDRAPFHPLKDHNIYLIIPARMRRVGITERPGST